MEDIRQKRKESMKYKFDKDIRQKRKELMKYNDDTRALALMVIGIVAILLISKFLLILHGLR